MELLKVVKESVLGNVDFSFALLGDHIKQIPDRQQRHFATADEYFLALQKYPQDKIAVATLNNSDRFSINELIHERLIQQGKGFSFLVSNGDLHNPVERDIKLSVGDRIICLKNDKRIGVRNGTRGKIIHIDNFGKITLQTDSGKIISFKSDSYNFFDLGYAMTINKLQGATVQKIICNADSNSHFDRNKFYVTVSRAKLDATILTDDKQKLQNDAQSWELKLTSDYFLHNLEHQIQENHSRTLHSNYLSPHQRALLLQQKFSSPELIQRNRNLNQGKIGTVTIDSLLPIPYSTPVESSATHDKNFSR